MKQHIFRMRGFLLSVAVGLAITLALTAGLVLAQGLVKDSGFAETCGGGEQFWTFTKEVRCYGSSAVIFNDEDQNDGVISQPVAAMSGTYTVGGRCHAAANTELVFSVDPSGAYCYINCGTSSAVDSCVILATSDVTGFFVGSDFGNPYTVLDDVFFYQSSTRQRPPRFIYPHPRSSKLRPAHLRFSRKSASVKLLSF